MSSVDSDFDKMLMMLVSYEWSIEHQIGNYVGAKRIRGVNGWIALCLMFFLSLIGMVIVLIWIAVSGTQRIRLERLESEEYVAQVTVDTYTSKISDPHEFKTYLVSYDEGFKVDYLKAVLMGIGCSLFWCTLSQL